MEKLMKLLQSIGVLVLVIGLIMVFNNSVTAVPSTETRDFLFNDGIFTSSSYLNWTTTSTNPDTASAFMQFANDSAVTHTADSSGSAQMSMLTNKGTSTDTGMYQYQFTTPPGYSTATLSFWYRADLTGTNFNWDIINSAGTVVVNNGAANFTPTAANTWYQKTSAAITTALAANTTYTLRLKSTIASTGVTNYSWFDDVKLNLTWADDLAPTIVSMAPDTAVILQGTVNLSAVVRDPSGVKSVAFKYSPTGLNTWTTITTLNTVSAYTGTYTTPWNTAALAEGRYDVQVVATDNTAANNHTSTTTYTYTVDNSGPVISNIAPATNTVLSGYTQTLSANVSDFDNIKSVEWQYLDTTVTPNEWVTIDTVKPTSQIASGSFSVTWHTTNVKDGSYSVRLVAKDRTPLELTTTSASMTYVVNNLAPVLKNVAPETGSAIKGTSATLSVDLPNTNGDANPMSLVKWEYSNNGGTSWTQIGTDNTPTGANNNYSLVWNTTGLPDGNYLVRITATDATTLAKTTTYQATYTIDNTAPTLNRADVITKNLVSVIFNDANMTSTSATTPANYTVYETLIPANTLSVTQAVAKQDGTGVKLTTSDQKPGTSYTVQVNAAVTDKAGNLISGTRTTTFTGSSAVKGNPHGGYSTTESWCAKCHSSHTSSGQQLTTQSAEKLLCYMCHDDSGLSVYDIRKEFGAVNTTGSALSKHPVPQDTQKCTTCHEPHLEIAGTPKLIQVKDGNNHTYNSGNNSCWGCHGNSTTHGSTRVNLTGVPGVDDHETYYVTTPGLDGSKQGAHSNITNPLLQPQSGAQISCTVCHEEHGSEHTKLMKSKVNNTVVDGDDNSLCFGCHVSSQGSFLGQAVWEDTTYSAHSRKDTGAIYPGGTYGPNRTTDSSARGKCVNCHNLHGTPNGKALVDRFTTPAYNDTSATTNYALCFKCHSAGGVANKNIQQYMVNTYNGSARSFGGTQGHFILNANRYKDASGTNFLVQGWKIPCFDCHNTHGSTGENRFLLKGDIGTVDGRPALSHLFKGTIQAGRDFCTQCHHTSNDTGVDHSYRGSTIPKLPSTNPQHSSDTAVNPSPLECNFCHGGGDLVKGVHAPNSGRSEGGLECDLCHTNLAGKMGTTSTLSRHYMSDFDADQTPSKYDASAISTYSTTCLSACHVDHDMFNNDPDTAKRFLRTTGGNSAAVPGQMTAVLSTTTDVSTFNGLCLSTACHGKPGGVNNPEYTSPSGLQTMSDVNAQSNSAYRHPITQVAHNTYVVQSTLNATFWTTWSARTVKKLSCTDCHTQVADAGGGFNNLTKGPHGQANRYMLKGTSLGNVNTLKGGSTFQTYDTLCTTCHSSTVYGGNGAVGTGSGSKAFNTHTKTQHYQFAVGSEYNPYGCLGCHGGNSTKYGRMPDIAPGSIHGNSVNGMVNGNLVASYNGASCTAKVGDPSATKCNMGAHAP